ncbi:hypothetical protein DX933_01815 [Ornithinibacillus gellani]|uniref:hypothetical protein n=1 Tax=Ornithinibacillus gellani TaxID=2293253 RepID=UPI000F47E01E|nr:hypothetical protein [Ornithinibacillus gellani]TQS76369.1 hypothetical protein DX933_01815 [Ornithinibacillus gellani]
MKQVAQIRMEKNDLLLEVDLSDLQPLIEEANRNMDLYKDEIAVIHEKMPKFDYTYFCFYAYSTYRLLEATFQFDTAEVGHFRLIAPDSFYYAFYGMIETLHAQQTANA